MSSAKAVLLWLLGAYLAAVIVLDVVSMRSGRSGGMLINGDAKGYYAWLRSIALDRDIDFRNDFVLIYGSEHDPAGQRLTPRGLIADRYSIGVALVEAPGFVAGHVAAKALGFPADGVSAPYQLGVVLWLQLFCLASFVALWAGLVRAGASGRVATLVIASALLATNIVQYIGRPAYAHGPGVALLNLAYFLVIAARGARNENRLLIGAGVLLGLALIVRPSNIALAPWAFAVLAANDNERWRGHAGRIVLGAIPPIAIHLSAMWMLWGSLRITGYTEDHFDGGLSGVAKTLLSSRHGLFVYHPWYLLMLGLVVAAWRRPATRQVAAGTLLSFATLAVINGSWWSWWFGDSFGNRAFIELIPALTVPAALWLSSVEAKALRRFAIASGALAALNMLLWTGYVTHRFPPDGLHSVADAYLWPWRQ